MTERTCNPPPEKDMYLREIRDAVVGIHNILQKQSVMDKTDGNKSVGMQQHKNAVDVFLSKEVVLEQLRIGQTTLAKWRFKKCIKYHSRGTRLITYSYIALMDALADNKLNARGFNPYAAYKRMLEWYQKNIEITGQQKER